MLLSQTHYIILYGQGFYLCLTLLFSLVRLSSSFLKLSEDMELECLRQTEVLYYRLERSHSNAAPQLKHNPWSLKCQQQHLQKMKENAKHRNQYSILFSRHSGKTSGQHST